VSFFVLGLPRSRTAWLANFLTYGDLFCHHEASNGCKSMAEYKDKIQDDGDSNTAIALFNIEEEFPDAKFIIIDSPPEKAIEYSLKTYGIENKESILEMKAILDNIDGLHIPVNDIDNRLEDIWNYVSSDHFNEKRAKLLSSLNIQILDPHTLDLPSLIEFTHDSL